MIDITELPAKWLSIRDENVRGFLGRAASSCEYSDAFKYCAQELAAALPKWTRITEDESSWPGNDELVLIVGRSGQYYITYITWGEAWDGVWWRPIILGLDTPPEGK